MTENKKFEADALRNSLYAGFMYKECTWEVFYKSTHVFLEMTKRGGTYYSLAKMSAVCISMYLKSCEDVSQGLTVRVVTVHCQAVCRTPCRKYSLDRP